MRQEFVDGLLQGGRVGPHAVEGHSSRRVDQESGIRHLAAVGPVYRSRKVVDQDRPGYPLLAFVLTGILQLLRVRAVWTAELAGVGLPEKDVEELYPVAVPVVELFDRRDRAGGDRSGGAPEVQQH